MTEKILQELARDVIQHFDENTKKITVCLSEFEEPDIWKRPNENSNSVGNLILHLCGNIRQWIISSLGKAEDVRERANEFAAGGGYSKSQLTEKLFSTIDEAKRVIESLSVEDLLKKRKVQGYSYSGMAILIHVTEHYSYHTGQIIFWTKLLKNKDLGFYAGVNLDVMNENEK